MPLFHVARRFAPLCFEFRKIGFGFVRDFPQLLRDLPVSGGSGETAAERYPFAHVVEGIVGHARRTAARRRLFLTTVFL